MRILFSSAGAYGHFFPLVPLARAASAAGHSVAFATAEAMADDVRATGFELLPTGLSQQARIDAARPYREAWEALPPEKRRGRQFVTHFARIAAPANFRDLLAATRSWRADVIVHESAELAAPIVAAVLRVPSVNHGFGRKVPLAILADAGEVVAPLWAQAGIEPPPFAGSFRDLYVDPCPPSLQHEPPPIDRVALVRPVGFDGATDDVAPDWLRGLPDRPTVYVTLGTVFNDVSVFGVLLDGLRGENLNVILTTGRDIDPADLGPQPANVRVERYVPQSAILGSCSAVVSHAGSGSMLAALARGLPMVLTPRAADQFDNADGCVKVGAAIRIMPADLTGAAVRAAVATVLSDAKYREAARGIADEIASMPPPAAVVPVIESLVPTIAR